MSSKTGTLFHCPNSDLLGDSGRVEWEVYEKVDLTEQEYRGIRQGPYFISCVLAFNKHTETSHYFRFGSGGIMHGVPADAREDHIWIKKQVVLVNSSLNTCFPKYHPFSSTIKLN